jgi:hypothetical protein
MVLAPFSVKKKRRPARSPPPAASPRRLAAPSSRLIRALLRVIASHLAAPYWPPPRLLPKTPRSNPAPGLSRGPAGRCDLGSTLPKRKTHEVEIEANREAVFCAWLHTGLAVTQCIGLN